MTYRPQYLGILFLDHAGDLAGDLALVRGHVGLEPLDDGVHGREGLGVAVRNLLDVLHRRRDLGQALVVSLGPEHGTGGSDRVASGSLLLLLLLLGDLGQAPGHPGHLALDLVAVLEVEGLLLVDVVLQLVEGVEYLKEGVNNLVNLKVLPFTTSRRPQNLEYLDKLLAS